MFGLPYELQCLVMGYLNNKELYPLNRDTKVLYLSNVVWKPRLCTRFGALETDNCFKEYCWRLQLEKHQLGYKRQWTLGCVGRVTPPTKPFWMPAVI